jgi:hypothetical protein
MTTQQVASRYYELFNQNKREEIVEELYGQDIACREPEHAISLGVQTLTQGIDAIKAKAKAGNERIEEVHASFCTEPAVAGNFFSMAMGREITLKAGPRIKREEIALFEVKDGKIVLEQFFY